ncbi:MAG: ATP-dependent helicase [Armatimonadota bacterium]
MKKINLLSLDPAQRKAAHDINGPVLIYAGAGAGKTRVIAARVAILLGNGVPPDEILCITFTNKAAEEMKQRISQYACRDVSEMWIGTFHAICARILRKYNEDSNFTIYDTTDTLSAVRRVMGAAYINPRDYPPGELLREISCYKRALLSDGFLDNLRSRCGDRWPEIFSKVFLEYQEELERCKVLDFDDLLMNTVLMLRGSQSVLDSVSGRFRYVLIDEYHDTAEIESLLINLLTIKHGNLCVVADPKQSIYRFRGSDHRIAARFPEDYAGTSIHILSSNYRNARHIIKASEILIQSGVEPTLYMTTPKRRESGLFNITNYRSDTEESDSMAREIKRLHNTGITFASIAVLCRTNRLAQQIESSLIRNGIPCQRSNSSEFYARKDVRCVLAYLRLIINPQDRSSAEYVLKNLWQGIGNRTLSKLRAIVTDGVYGSSSKPANISIPAWTGIQQFHGTLIHVTLMADLGKPISEIISYIMRETPLREMANQSLEDLMILSTRDTSPSKDALPGFLEKIALTDSSEMTADIQDKIRIMTIHQAKGLEFPVVFMPGVEEGLIPHMMSSCEAEIEEERRLCYVGMTRAVNRLYMSSAGMRQVSGVSRKVNPSRFLKELDICHQAQ